MDQVEDTVQEALEEVRVDTVATVQADTAVATILEALADIVLEGSAGATAQAD